MADSDPEYEGSDDDVQMNGAGPSKGSAGRAMVSRPKGRAKATWEAAPSSNRELPEGADGSLEGVLGGIEEAGKRKRYFQHC